MFCPVGYRSAAELWTEFLRFRLEALNDSAVASYNDPKFVAGLTRGSPLDICEHVFLVALSTVGIHLASPSGDIVRVHVRYSDSLPCLFLTLGTYAAAWQEPAESFSTDNTISINFLENGRFKSWDHEVKDGESWAKTYKEFSHLLADRHHEPFYGLFHHTLPCHFLRHSYVIAADVPAWAVESSLSIEVAPILENYAGWAICLDDATYNGEWQEYLTGRKQFYQKHEDSVTIAARGRPKMINAQAAFEAMDFAKGDLSWEQVSRKIERETGEKPSPKALRNWRDAHEAKKST